MISLNDGVGKGMKSFGMAICIVETKMSIQWILIIKRIVFHYSSLVGLIPTDIIRIIQAYFN